MKKFWLPILVVIIGLYFGHKQVIRHLIYFPDSSVSDRDLSQLKSLGFKPYENRGYLRVVDNPNKVVVIFHGNAGNAAQRYYLTEGFLDGSTVVYLAEYPGYGNRPGKPTEKNLYEAALADTKKLQEKFPGVPLYLMGESLGTGVVSWLSQKIPTKGMILISPFTSLVAAGKSHYPFLPVGLLLPDKFDSLSYLKNSQIPLLIIHGEQDNLVPFSLGKELYQAYPGPKEFLPLEGYSHNDLPWHDTASVIWQKIRSYFFSI